MSPRQKNRWSWSNSFSARELIVTALTTQRPQPTQIEFHEELDLENKARTAPGLVRLLVNCGFLVQRAARMMF